MSRDNLIVDTLTMIRNCLRFGIASIDARIMYLSICLDTVSCVQKETSFIYR